MTPRPNASRRFDPTHVRFLALGDMGSFFGGLTGKSKADFSKGASPFVSYLNVYENLSTNVRPADTVRIEPGERQHTLQRGDILFTGSSETRDEVGMSSVVTQDVTGPLYLNSFCFAFRLHDPSLLNPHYSKHLFRSAQVREQIVRAASGVTRFNLSRSRLAQARIPIPPANVQAELARILDLFLALPDELQNELWRRRAQRLAFMDQLPESPRIQELSPEGRIEVPLGKLANRYVEPVRVQPDEMYVNLGVKWYGEGVFAREPKLGRAIKGTTLYRVKPRQFIYNRLFVTEGSFGLIPPNLAHGYVSSEFPVYDLDETRVVPDWLLLQFQDPNTVRAAAAETTGGTKSRRRWKEAQFEAFTISLPSLSAQREVVRVNGAFRELESQITAEITARQRQYSYYRDSLLAFDWAAA